jgi:hypothetical protein
MIHHQRDHPKFEPNLVAVLFELLPEDLLRFGRRERVKSVATARGNEVDLIVDVPVLVAVLTV